MEAIYIAQGASKRIIKMLCEKTGANLGLAGHKFGRLLINGFIANGVNIKELSAISMNRYISKQLLWNLPDEVEEGITYEYIPFLNIPILHQIGVSIYVFFYVLIWGSCKKKNKFIFIDIINTSLSIGALLAAKIVGVKIIGCMTDMPGLMVESSCSQQEEDSLFAKISFFINRLFISSFDAYVFLTEQMNERVNNKKRPYIIMEGLVDSNINLQPFVQEKEKAIKSILYAGGLHEKYGLKLLVEGFHLISNPNYRLVLYGSGPYVEELNRICKIDRRVEYRGLATNEEVVNAEMSATILVNPRPTNEEFTKFSFPSKNMEYMASGRPLLTTALPGMPNEYYDFVYILSDETIEGYSRTIDEILSLPSEILSKKGFDAKKWVIKNKNNISQTKRIVDLVISI